jgi:iron complex transport system ATP-binding protein
MIEVRKLSFAYRKPVNVLAKVSFEFEKGQILTILGPNGCGKTTLLKAILGFLPIAGGSVFINGAPVESYSRSLLAKLLAYVPQSAPGVYPYKVRDMVLMGRTCRRRWGGFDREDPKIAARASAQVGVETLADRAVTELSGGQRQLVIIARALAQDSQFILMDEPTTGLDLSNQAMVLKAMKRLHEEEKVSFLLTTHHPEQAVFLGGQALMIKMGRVVATGTAKNLATPKALEDLYDLEPGLLAQMGLAPACFGPA